MRATVITLVGGSAAGAGIALLLTPLLSRQFDPVAFGTFATVLAVATGVSGLITGRHEVHAVADGDAGNAHARFRLAAWQAVALAAALGVVLAVLVWAGALGAEWLYLAPVTLAASFALVGNSYLAYQRRYRTLSALSGLQQASLPMWQITAGILSHGLPGLAAGFVLSRLGWIAVVARTHRAPASSVATALRRHGRTGVVAGLSAGVNGFAGQAVVLVTVATYGVHAAGIMAMAVRVLVGPLALLGNAVSAAAVGEIGSLVRTDRAVEARSVFRKGMRDLLVLGVIPTVVVAAVPTDWIDSVLGAEWVGTGDIIKALTIGAFAQLVVAPFSQLLNVLGASRALLAWDVVRAAALVGTLALAHTLGYGFAIGVVAYSVSQVLLYLILARTVDVTLTQREDQA